MLFLLPLEYFGKLFFGGRFVLYEISLRLKSGEHFVLRIIYFSADNLIAATDTTHLYIYSPHDRQEFKYKKQGNALQLVTGEDSTFYVMKKYCFSTLQSAEYLVKEHKTVNKATGQ